MEDCIWAKDYSSEMLIHAHSSCYLLDERSALNLLMNFSCGQAFCNILVNAQYPTFKAHVLRNTI